jgi:16S rRNA (uracil1498-N3)-methyltransferase
MSQRFFVNSPISAGRVVLAGAEAHHLRAVMRAVPGDVVTLFDGSGTECTARIETLSNTIELTIIERCSSDKELSIDLTLAVALPKGDRQRWLVEKLVELGAARLIPLIAARGIAQPTSSALNRLNRWVVEASKQCCRSRLMEIGAAEDFSKFVARKDLAPMRLLAHPCDTPLRKIWPAVAPAEIARRVVVAIGPEGGFTDDEVGRALAAGWRAIDLGPRILRVETAAIAAASWISLTATGAQSPSP